MKTKLIEAAAMMEEPRDFGVGDLITWKSLALANRQLPESGGCAVVISLDDGSDRRAEPNRPDSPYFNDRLNMVVGVIDEDGDYMEFSMDSRRFKKVAERVQH